MKGATDDQYAAIPHSAGYPHHAGVAVICFMLVQIAPGDPLVSVMPPDASEALRQTLMQAYGFDKPLPLQFIHWLWRALHGDLGMSVATGRPVIDEVITAWRTPCARAAGDGDRLRPRQPVRLCRRLFSQQRH